MLKKIIKITAPATIFIGIITFAIYLMLGSEMTIIEQYSYEIGNYTWVFYKIDIVKYLQNLQNSIKITNLLEAIPQRPELQTKPSSWDTLGMLKYIINILFIYITNWLIFITNVIFLLPLKILIYPVMVMYSLLGLDTGSQDAIGAVKYIYNLNIPLIPTI